MYENYLNFGGVEIINAERTMAYLKAFAPGLDIKCDADGLHTALGQNAYVSPDVDNAPWYNEARPFSAGFYGLITTKVEGSEDSTRRIDTTELTGDGAIPTTSRHASRETRFSATAFAKDEEAMNEGITWLKDVLAADSCGNSVGLGCSNHQAMMFIAKPVNAGQMTAWQRTFYRTETSEGPLVTERLGFKKVVGWTVEFTLFSGRPWAFTLPATYATLDLPSGGSFTDPAGENCSLANEAYDDFINDPYFTNIEKPPRPAVILPPNILDINSWRRRTYALPSALTDRWGKIAPIVKVQSGGADVQFVRIRFYRGSTLSGCDYDGEFLVSYLPANALLVMDGVRKEISVTLADGRVVPGGHLIYGSDGRPFMWPNLGCQQAYTMCADMMPGQTGVTVILDASTQE